MSFDEVFLIMGYPTRPDPINAWVEYFLPDKKTGQTWAEFFDPKPDPTRPDPNFVHKKSGLTRSYPNPTRPCDGSASNQKIQPDGWVGLGTDQRKKCQIFFDLIRIRPDPIIDQVYGLWAE